MQCDSGASSSAWEGASPAGRCGPVDAAWLSRLVRTTLNLPGAEAGAEVPWLLVSTLNLEPLWSAVTDGGAGRASGADLASWFLERRLWFGAWMFVLLSGQKETEGPSLPVVAVV